MISPTDTQSGACPRPAYARSRRLAPLGLAGVVVVLAVAGCGSENAQARDDAGSSGAATSGASASSDPTSTSSTPSPSTSDASSSYPSCASVWVADATLPTRYRGCLDDQGIPVDANALPCSFGGSVVSYDNRFYALTGHRINRLPDLSNSRQYRSAVTACQA